MCIRDRDRLVRRRVLHSGAHADGDLVCEQRLVPHVRCKPQVEKGCLAPIAGRCRDGREKQGWAQEEATGAALVEVVTVAKLAPEAVECLRKNVERVAQLVAVGVDVRSIRLGVRPRIERAEYERVVIARHDDDIEAEPVDEQGQGCLLYTSRCV